MAGGKSNPNIYMCEIVKDLIIVESIYLQVRAPINLLPPTWPHFSPLPSVNPSRD